ncbi:MAG: hypothetical protein K2Y33_14905 [Mycolicibacterium frederiksbergense]|nr:hypothetical protein [Mycolicibacterium frederiksbergense]
MHRRFLSGGIVGFRLEFVVTGLILSRWLGLGLWFGLGLGPWFGFLRWRGFAGIVLLRRLVDLHGLVVVEWVCGSHTATGQQ